MVVVAGPSARAPQDHPPEPAGDRQLRTTASHTIGVPRLAALFTEVRGHSASAARFTEAVLADNVLERSSMSGRTRALRHLRELYGLDPAEPRFRMLTWLHQTDPASLPLLAGLIALRRDLFMTVTAERVLATPLGAAVTSDDLTTTVRQVLPDLDLGTSTLAKIGRNTGASWTQTGHLSGRSRKTRRHVVATPSAITMATALAWQEGARGRFLLNTRYTQFLDLVPERTEQLLGAANRSGLLTARLGGGMVDIAIEWPTWVAAGVQA